jgi:4-amino-4-deoxy-L-arabinose transferase-like glycosyltransferase
MTDATAKPSRIMAPIQRWPRVILFIVCLIAWLPGFFTIPPLDRDESRFAQASKQMLETHDFVDIRFGHEPRYKKPVGIYWLQAAATEAVSPLTGGARDVIWTYRIPSLLGAVAAVMLAFWCARAFLGIEGAFLSALLLGLTILLSSEAKIAKTDAVLLATVLGAQGVLLRAYLARDPDHPPVTFRLSMLGWLSFALGILIKGPVIAGVCGVTVISLVLSDSAWRGKYPALIAIFLTTLVAVLLKAWLLLIVPAVGLAVIVGWQGEWRWLGKLRPLWGLGLTVLIAAPWLVAILLKSHGTFYEQSLGHDFGAKLAGGQESHGLPPGYYLMMTTVTFWPATLFLAPALAGAIALRRQAVGRFLLAWTGGWWLIEFVPTKLPNYILPAYPALAMIVAAFILAPREADAPMWRRRIMPWVSTVHFLLGAGLLIAGIIVLPRLYGSGTSWDLMAAAAVIGVASLLAALLAMRGSNGAAVAMSVVAAIVAMATLTLDVMPRLDQLMVSPREAAMVAKHIQPSDPAPVLSGYTEPSAVFLLGTETHLAKGYDAAEIAAQQGGLALIEDGQRSAFLARLAEDEADATAIDALSGFNYSRGRPVHITLYRVTPPHEVTMPPEE